MSPPLVQTTVCRAAVDVCDLPETCDGTSNACPTDAYKPATEVCRESAGLCDVPETCTGISAACPDDAFKPDVSGWHCATCLHFAHSL